MGVYVAIRDVRAGWRDGAHRVSAQVDGAELWFESPDLSLRPCAEAFACATLIAAAFNGRGISYSGQVGERWRQGVREALKLAASWWRLPALAPLETPMAAPPPRPPSAARRRGVALCFSGGLDSFYSLLRGRRRPDFLVTVHGFDMRLNDLERWQAYYPTLEHVAQQAGAWPIVIRTNLRQHPLMARAPWHYAHGGALAALGHLLADHIDKLVVASSVATNFNVTWGSHWKLDHLWSSDDVEIVHDGAEVSRADKLRALAAEPLLFDHLRVCWENRGRAGNCGRCDKCLCTMLLLEQAGQLDRYRVFRAPASYVPLLDAAPRTTFVRTYKDALEHGLPPDVAAAVRRLLARTRAQAGWRKAARRLLQPGWMFGRLAREIGHLIRGRETAPRGTLAFALRRIKASWNSARAA
jgi:hypothetical protein